ncbi:LytR C-terminal domain-containing protein [uncultured Corynebacterium sp.]|uniref:LytR C-terminal domain-containing protein n=1 Tax=uncultured Corynebacterium sp. TaxID=159447 RepID=UPI0025EC7782|nr:LytR C-terminal domain-containing protein [uncultured Corynebacterium sp.]
MTHRQDMAPPPRRIAPYAVLVVVFALVAAVAWTLVFTRTVEATNLACGRDDAGRVVSATDLLGEAPVRPGDIPVRVLNANGESGQATEVFEGLSGLGFGAVAEGAVGNDPLSPGLDLDCYGQLRFGSEFAAHGATMHAIFPCLELIDDGRGDPSVDVALGTGFRDLDDSGPVRAAMETLQAGEEVDAATLQSLSGRTC